MSDKRFRYASMEPGRKDREHLSEIVRGHPLHRASMEPGRKDREHTAAIALPLWTPTIASMEPGRKDREHSPPSLPASHCSSRLNGTRP